MPCHVERQETLMSQLHYLTVQDVLWINLQLTKKVQEFKYARLEEATFYQYSYGTASGIWEQAARLAGGFVKMGPLGAGNAATAFVATMTFLHLNQVSPAVGDKGAVAWFDALASGKASGEAAQKDGHGAPDVRSTIKEVLEHYPSAIAELARRA
jgi:prophage maintenance system killer protein